MADPATDSSSSAKAIAAVSSPVSGRAIPTSSDPPHGSSAHGTPEASADRERGESDVGLRQLALKSLKGVTLGTAGLFSKFKLARPSNGASASPSAAAKLCALFFLLEVDAAVTLSALRSSRAQARGFADESACVHTAGAADRRCSQVVDCRLAFLL